MSARPSWPHSDPVMPQLFRIALLLLATAGGLMAQSQPSLPAPELAPLQLDAPAEGQSPLDGAGNLVPDLPGHSRVAENATEKALEGALFERRLEGARVVGRRGGNVWIVVLVAGLALLGLLVGAWSALRRA